jgi:hypothetical protein
LALYTSIIVTGPALRQVPNTAKKKKKKKESDMKRSMHFSLSGENYGIQIAFKINMKTDESRLPLKASQLNPMKEQML